LSLVAWGSTTWRTRYRCGGRRSSQTMSKSSVPSA
jgi:hypothetical protein